MQHMKMLSLLYIVDFSKIHVSTSLSSIRKNLVCVESPSRNFHLRSMFIEIC